ncbi:MAG: hypothetical protein H7833_12145 [Magnetococcus sp. DMHC-1]|nr:hypothetical protein [Magnetococcales bacterium]
MAKALLPAALEAAYRLLDHEYTIRTPDRNPPKTSLTMHADGQGVPIVYLNQMMAVLSDGTFGSKLVFVDEGTHRLGGRVVVYDKSFALLVDQDAETITALRCGLMAALAMDRYFRCTPRLRRDLTIGFIGTGRINQMTAWVLRTLWGCERFLIRGSPTHINKHAALFPECAKVADGIRDFSNCNVIVACTNNRSAEHLIETDAIHGPILFIAQDGGYLLGSSFRQRFPSFTDDMPQLSRSLQEEFPFDRTPVSLVGDLNHPAFLEQGNQPATAVCVYLYGIALADVVTALFHLKIFSG